MRHVIFFSRSPQLFKQSGNPQFDVTTRHCKHVNQGIKAEFRQFAAQQIGHPGLSNTKSLCGLRLSPARSLHFSADLMDHARTKFHIQSFSSLHLVYDSFALFGHHWVGKSVLSLVAFGVLYLVFGKIRQEQQSQRCLGAHRDGCRKRVGHSEFFYLALHPENLQTSHWGHRHCQRRMDS